MHANKLFKNFLYKSLHWTHQFAEQACIVSSVPIKQVHQKRLKDIQLIELLPSSKVLNSLKETWGILISRVLCKYVKVLRCFKDIVIHHIPHKYSEEMAKKSMSENLIFA